MSVLCGRYVRVRDDHEALRRGLSTREADDTNSFRLLLIEACGIYLRAILDDNEQTSNFGAEGLLDLLAEYSGDQKTCKIPFVWLEESIPSGPDAESDNFNLDGAIRCYCEAAWCHLRKNRSPWAQELALRLGRHVEQREVARYALGAIERLDLSSTLYLLQTETASHVHMAQVLLLAARLAGIWSSKSYSSAWQPMAKWMSTEDAHCLVRWKWEMSTRQH